MQLGRFAIALTVWITVFSRALTASAAETPTNFLYQLQDFDVAKAAASPYALLVIDYSLHGGEDSELNREDVESLRDGGRRTVLAYFSIGEAEDYRFYWQRDWRQDPPEWLGPRNRIFPGNYRVRFWDPAWQEMLFGREGREGAYLDRILAQGFDGVYLDLVDVYHFWKTERPKAAREMVELVLAIAAYARERVPGFLVYPQNAAELVARFPEYLAAIDGIGAESTWWVKDRPQKRRHIEKLTRGLDMVRDAGKPVLAIDYPQQRKQIDDFYSKAEARGYIPFNSSFALDRLRINPRHPPTGGPRVESLEPANGDSIAAENLPRFSWSGSEGAVEYQVSVTASQSFAWVQKMPGEKKFEASTTYTPDARLWRKVTQLAEDGELFWWVTARDRRGRLRSTRARRLILER